MYDPVKAPVLPCRTRGKSLKTHVELLREVGMLPIYGQTKPIQSCTGGQVLLIEPLGLDGREELRRAHGMAVKTDRAAVPVKRHERLWAPFKQVGSFTEK